MKCKIIFILFILNNTVWASVDSVIKDYLFQEEGCRNIAIKEDRSMPIFMNHLVNHTQNAVYPEAISCDPNNLEKYPFKDFFIKMMEGNLNINPKTLCANTKFILSNGKFNLDWESPFKDLPKANDDLANQKIKLKLNITNHSIALVKSCQWQWGPDQTYKAVSESQSCAIEINDFFYHNKAEFVSSYSPDLISKKIKECLAQFPNTLIEKISLFISSDGSHAQGTDLKLINEQLTKDRFSKIKTQLANILNSKDLRSNAENEIKIESTLGWNDFGSSGPEKIITTNDSSAKQDLQKYRKTTITVFLRKKLEHIISETFRGNLILNCLSNIYSCVQTDNSLGKEFATIILNNDSNQPTILINSSSAKGI